MPFNTESKRATKGFVKKTNKFVNECEKNYKDLNKTLDFKKNYVDPANEIDNRLLELKTLTDRVLKGSAPAPSTIKPVTPGKS